MTPLRIISHIQDVANRLGEGTHRLDEIIEGYDVHYTLFVQCVQPPSYPTCDYPAYAGEYKVYLEDIECDDEEMTSEISKHIGEL